MARRKVTPQAQARADRIAAALSGLLEDVPPPVAPGSEADPYRRAQDMPRKPPSDPALPCPGCEGPMGIEHQVGVEIHRCRVCDGMWLDPGEIDEMIDPPATDTSHVDVQRLRHEMRAVASTSAQVRYRKCPRCRGVMNRRNFGGHSGIIVDECPQHGLFLDPGEFEAIETFIRMGGLQLAKQSAQRRMREQQRRAEQAKADAAAAQSVWTARRRYWWDLFWGW